MPRLYCWVYLCIEWISLLALSSLLLVYNALLCTLNFILSDIKTVIVRSLRVRAQSFHVLSYGISPATL